MNDQHHPVPQTIEPMPPAGKLTWHPATILAFEEESFARGRCSDRRVDRYAAPASREPAS